MTTADWIVCGAVAVAYIGGGRLLVWLSTLVR